MYQFLWQKWDLFLSSIGVKINGQHCWDILLSQQMLDAIKSWWQLCLSAIQCISGASWVQHSPTAAVPNSHLPFCWA